jgi:NAD(P)-dependent dehydrogenase (short-subunit alcohol dehydrogenase family)
MPFHPDALPDLTGKIYIVTGGTSGMCVNFFPFPPASLKVTDLTNNRGYHTISHLASHNAHVYMCARSQEKGNTAIARIKETHPAANISLLTMDHTDLSTVVSAADDFVSRETALHGLVNNAGIMATPFELTKDGYEAQWQTNYLAHWLFTELLLPVLLRTAKTTTTPGAVRIVNITSSGHLSAPKTGINFDDTSLKNDGPWARYGQSKLANILHTKTLHKRYGPGSTHATQGSGDIWVSCVHPGIVGTNLASSVGWFESMVFPILRLFGLFWTADKGSWNTLFCVAGSDMKPEQSGAYLEIFGRFGEPAWLSKNAKDGELAERLEEWTAELMRREGWLK